MTSMSDPDRPSVTRRLPPKAEPPEVGALDAYGVGPDDLDDATMTALADDLGAVTRALAGEAVDGVAVQLRRVGSITVSAAVERDGRDLEVIAVLDLASGVVSRSLWYRDGDTELHRSRTSQA